ncbi:erythrocyte membrane protein 1, PfEMP1, putative [Plasmodium reichenowi]|uniref:Erythrocyte membrane protein 1, PfEMP1, putative n=1 Tax=Plasmodium reichenowi TaxID=5854 RepID=A0A2P9D5J7_PLARE|nr:erythrocyte membrane protein 1, PfEMP1, putative [Plasmodium reichenowi]
MAPQGGGIVGVSGSGNDKYKYVKDAKNLFDDVGKTVQKNVQENAKKYYDALHGDLSKVTYPNDDLRTGSTPNDPCQLQYDYNTNITGGFSKEYPCRNGREKRFSDTEGAQCHSKKIKDSNSKEGACAPYRRLNLCVRNLENISDFDKINTKDNLLLEVCLAALHEGESIRGEHVKYRANNSDLNTNICTELARSFADIGDTIRGKDLYRGDNGKDKLEKSLKTIFNNIKTKNPKLNDLSLDKVREYWWELNREKVWTALTCHVPEHAKYLGLTCSDGRSSAEKKCRCISYKVPTYFDYVPQYLRWFEEWAEDFCGKRKKQLENAKEQCRKGLDQNNEPRYCDFNGYDCKKTASGKHKYLWDHKCTGCFFSCSDFRKWIKNQKQEFLKQKEKYDKEIKKAEEKDQTSYGKSNNIYEKEFYKELKRNYESVDSFLQLLSKETACKDQPYDDEKKKPINFSKDEETFAPTEYCEPCPWCGVTKEKDKWKRLTQHTACPNVTLYTPKKNATPTKINVLTSGEGHDDINKKLEQFCAQTKGNSGGGSTSVPSGGKSSDKDSLYEDWQCYKHNEVEKVGEEDEEDYENIRNAGGLCILEKKDGEKSVNKQKTFNNFFNFWVAHVLKDSIEWRNKLKSCIQKAKTGKCGNKQCKNKCECYESWVQQKEEEWKLIEEHYEQENFNGADPYVTLEWNLQNDYLQMIKDAYKGVKSVPEFIKEIENIIQKFKGKEKEATNENNSINNLLEYEAKEAKECKKCTQTHNKDPCDNTDGARIGKQRSAGDENDEDEESEDDEAPKQQQSRTNPCSGEVTKGGTATKYPVLAHKVAQKLHEKARADMLERSGKNGGESKDKAKGVGKDSEKVSVLRGDIKQAEFKEGKRSDLDNCNICIIDKKHSKAATTESKDPCHGKGEGFDIGTDWKPGNSKSSTPEVYIRPRREHMCTSNLEKLDVNNVTSNGNVNDTFLVDVLLAAKSEAEYIKKKYQTNDGKNGLKYDEVTTCRAMKSSFADIGDIIRGKDLWDKDQSSTDIKNKLENIFPKIKEEIKKKHPEETKKKYDGDTNHKLLREDWWTANRHIVWKAMKCHTSDMNCDSDTPYDDYIPQRLRWMTEWAEWFCKAQNKYYGELEDACGSCKGNAEGQCKEGTPECIKCTAACKKYGENITKWKTQWYKIQIPYITSYQRAQANYVGTAYLGADNQQMLDFLAELIRKSGGGKGGKGVDPPNSPYATSEGYVHQEARVGECDEQNEFCYYKNGVASTSAGGGKQNEKYAFKNPPKDHDDACKCKTRPAPTVPKRGEEDNRKRSEDGEQEPRGPIPQPPPATPPLDVCPIVATALTKDTLEAACPTKYGSKAPSSWKCIPTTTTTRDTPGGKPGDSTTSGDTGGICIPPRRRKLYIGKIKEWATKQNTGDTTLSGGESSSDAGSGEVKGPNGDSTPATSQSQSDLLTAFVESAAIETFFLWHQYKQLHKTPQEDGGVPQIPSVPQVLPVGAGPPTIAGVPSVGGFPGAGGIPGVGVPGAGIPIVPGGSWTQGAPSEAIRGPNGMDDGPSPGGTLTLLDGNLLIPRGPHGHNGLQLPSSHSGPLEPNHPDNLQNGKIPNDFLKQMFYTLGDYADILFGKNDILIQNTGTGGSEKDEMSQREEEIKNAIEKFFKPGGEQSSPVKTPTQSSDTPSSWWEENGPHIWNGMICALTYKENDPDTSAKGEEKIEKIDNPDNLWDNTKNKPKEDKYLYDQVRLKDDDSGTEPISNEQQPTTLKDFVLRPPFFRYLQEWGESFCGMRKKMLKKIYKECRGDYDGDKYCSGDGYHCTDTNVSKKDLFADLNCRGCEKECTNYRKWIDIKFKEYESQNNKYGSEHGKLEELSSSNVNYQKLKDYTSVAQFLQALKRCKNSESDDDKDKEYEKNKIDFHNSQNTFNPSTYCKACPLNGVTCGGRNGCTRNRENNKRNLGGKSKGIDVLINYGATNDTDSDLDKNCKDYGLYKDLRTHKWQCQHLNEIYKCKLTNYVTSEYYHDEIPFNILFHRWIKDFLDDYYKSNKQIEVCTKKGENKCECVKKWIEKKREEWTNIKEHFQEQEHGDPYDIAYIVKSFFEKDPFLGPFIKAIKGDKDIEGFKELDKCKDEACYSSNIGKINHDFITKLLDGLQKKITTCQNQPSGQTPSTCDKTLTLVEDIDTLDDIHDDHYIVKPGVCNDKTVEKPKDKKEEEETEKGDKHVEPKEDEICAENKNVDCNKVGKGNNKLIQVPMDPKNGRDKDRNNDGDGNKCGGIDIKNNGEWKNKEDSEYPKLTEGIYVSPRRQKLCLKGLQDATDETQLKDKLLTAAANEGYNLGIKYDEYKNKYTVHPCNALEYSFYDYEHIILGDDPLEPDNKDIGKALKNLFNRKGSSGGGERNSKERQHFWNDNKSCVWSAMKCGYEKGRKYGKTNAPEIEDCENTPTEFDGVPQFLMWFTEWSEDFCIQRNKQLVNLIRGCTGCTVSGSGDNKTCDKKGKPCTECSKQCKIYKEWLKTWQEHYKKQEKKYKDDKITYENVPNVKDSPNAHDYLSKILNKLCKNSSGICDYTCMDELSTKKDSENIPLSLEYPPLEIEGRCTCKPPSPVPAPPPRTPEDNLPPPPAREPFDPTILQTTIPLGIALALTSIAFLFLKKKSKPPVDLFSVLEIPQNDYDMPTKLSPNRYIPYTSGKYRGKRYIYIEGDSSSDEKYAFMSDTTDITSSESEYEEFDINDIYPYQSPKYKTLIEVVLEPSKRDTTNTPNDIANGDTPTNKFTDNEWNELKNDFITNILQSEQNTEPNILSDNMDNNTHPTPSRDTLDQKAFIMSIHDRNLLNGEECNYDMANIVDSPYSGTKDPTSGNLGSYSDKNGPYSGTDLINDALSGNQPIDIYDEILKRKENELFGTNHVKHTSTHGVAKNTYSDPIMNQLDFFHKWFDRHRNMCEQWDTNNKKEELLDKLKEEWNKENNTNSGKIYNSDNKPSDNHVLNTDVSIQIDMDDPKPINIVDTNVDTRTMDIMEDDIYYDVNDDKTSMDNNNNLVYKNNPVDNNNSTYNHRNPADINKNFLDKNNQNQHPIEKTTKIQIEMNSNNREMVEQQYPISDMWNI